MFHVLLALPVLAAFGAMAVVVLSAVLAVWGAAFAMELALGLLSAGTGGVCGSRLLWAPWACC